MNKDLLLIIVGGGLGVVGTLVGTLFAYWLNKRSQRMQWTRDEFVRKAEWEQALRDPTGIGARGLLGRSGLQGGGAALSS
jgi:hypothetical protein